MRVGILTFHRAYNFGAVLQCYAMQEFLTSQGYDVYVIDYNGGKVYDIYKLLRTDGWKRFVKSVLFLGRNIKTRYIYHSFINKYLNLYGEKFSTIDDFKNCNVDCFVIGSDQVWSTKINKGIDPVYWGNFRKDINKIAYGASIGSPSEIEEYKTSIIELLGNFNSIAVREEWLQNTLNQLKKHINADWVLDPTLIVNPEVYERILENTKYDNYVLYYQREYNPKSKFIIQDIARELNCMVIIVSGVKEKYDVPYHYFGPQNLSVNSFLGLFKYAKCVFTSSFHGTAFSLIFKKDFYFLANSKVERSKSLLNAVDALDRIVLPDDKLTFSHVNYNNIDKKLSIHREHSRQYLINSINK